MILIALIAIGCEPEIPTSSKVGSVEVPVAPENYKMVLMKEGTVHSPINPPLYVSVSDSLVVLTDKVSTINRFYLGKRLIHNYSRVEDGQKKIFSVGLYKCRFPKYLGINEDIYAIGFKYAIDSVGNKSLEHISIETRLQTQKVYLYE